jgi:formylglycine-generating enzyme required for sulfatase activity
MGWNQRINERPIHPVQVQTFEIARAEITVAQYLQCMLANICEVPTSNESNWNIPGRANHPINMLSWYDARELAEFMGGRLPTEAEWEYVARYARGNDRYPWGAEEPNCTLANFSEDSSGESCTGSGTEPVCSKGAQGESALGICDLSGNLWEWVEDGYTPNYNSSPSDGSAAEGVGASKVIRGGGWQSGPETLTSTYRLEMSPSIRQSHIGVRIVKSVTPPQD